MSPVALPWSPGCMRRGKERGPALVLDEIGREVAAEDDRVRAANARRYHGAGW